jgi:thioester reductase-like protein
MGELKIFMLALKSRKLNWAITSLKHHSTHSRTLDITVFQAASGLPAAAFRKLQQIGIVYHETACVHYMPAFESMMAL